ncbi:MAG: YraN family protein, partial [Lachnospiraceae bacterium]
MTYNKRKVGQTYEQAVGEYLSRYGYEIIRYNYRCPIGEIDIIAKEGKVLVFCEVKYRKTNQMGDPLEAVTRKKQ